MRTYSIYILLIRYKAELKLFKNKCSNRHKTTINSPYSGKTNIVPYYKMGYFLLLLFSVTFVEYLDIFSCLYASRRIKLHFKHQIYKNFSKGRCCQSKVQRSKFGCIVRSWSLDVPLRCCCWCYEKNSDGFFLDFNILLRYHHIWSGRNVILFVLVRFF